MPRRAGVAMSLAAAAGATDADISVAELRRILGPHASEAQVLQQAAAFPTEARKAANLYFRSACAVADGPPFDFEPRLPPSEHRSSSPSSAASATPTGAEEEPPRGPAPAWLALEPRLFPSAMWLGVGDCAALLVVARAVRAVVAADDARWSEAYAAVFREPLPSAVGGQSCAERRSKGGQGDAYRRFLVRWAHVQARVCPACGQAASVVPVVHGFPSEKLTRQQRRGLLVLAENCGFLGPFWACLNRRCQAEWEQYPYAHQARPNPRGPIANTVLGLPPFGASGRQIDGGLPPTAALPRLPE